MRSAVPTSRTGATGRSPPLLRAQLRRDIAGVEPRFPLIDGPDEEPGLLRYRAELLVSVRPGRGLLDVLPQDTGVVYRIVDRLPEGEPASRIPYQGELFLESSLPAQVQLGRDSSGIHLFEMLRARS